MKILVGYDGSNSAKEALNLAKIHAKAFGASVSVVTSMEKGTEGQREEITQSEKGLEWAKSVFEEIGIECDTHLLIRGLAPGEDIVEYAKENQVLSGVRDIKYSIETTAKGNTKVLRNPSVLIRLSTRNGKKKMIP